MPPLRWIDPPPLPPELPCLHDDPLLHALLAARVADRAAAGRFLDAAMRPLPDPFVLPGMDAAVERVRQAIARKETVAIYGDYDADGVTSAAIAALALRAASGGVVPAAISLPTREWGYGLHGPEIERLAERGVTLLLAVDCGGSDRAEVALARSHGMDVVIVDHHDMPDGAPEGAIVVSTRVRPGAPYADLSAAGLALLLASGLARHGLDVGNGPGQEPRGLLDLAMIGTVADVCDLRGATRAIVRDGLRQMRVQPRPGLLALTKAIGLEPAKLDSRAIGRRIGPAINAPGRAGNPRPALDLLLADDIWTANGHAAEALAALATIRSERARLLERELDRVTTDPDERERPVLVVACDDCPHGIAGTLAGELVKAVQRPVVVLSRDGDFYRGSARSHGEFDMGGALRSAAELLVRTGGHRKAAGLVVHEDRVADLRDWLGRCAAAAGVAALEPAIQIDADIALERVALPTIALLDRLRPFGEGNPEPLLRVRGAVADDRRVIGSDGRHLKLRLRGPLGPVDAVGWGMADRLPEIAGAPRLDLVGRLGRNEWNGRRMAQLLLEDLRPAMEL
ncbi:MAG: DHH family phosphoesterase [Thermomicrobiales bacterium]|nr:DHH family phosphoesterase [Thermomicrobiales bacterium]